MRHGDIITVRHGDIITGRHGDIVAVRYGDIVTGRHGDIVTGRHGDIITGRATLCTQRLLSSRESKTTFQKVGREFNLVVNEALKGLSHLLHFYTLFG